MLRLHHCFQVDQRRFDITKKPCGFAIDRFHLNAPMIQRFIPGQPENEGTIGGVRLDESWRCGCHAVSIPNNRSENVAKLLWFRKALSGMVLRLVFVSESQVRYGLAVL
jgi:hypothetical protein